jgi:hypothetical protein
MINNTYQQYGIYTSAEPLEADLIQAYKNYRIRDVLSLDRDSAARVVQRIKNTKLPINQVLFHINPGSPAGECSTLFNNVGNYILGPQRPVLIYCRAGKDRTGFAVAAYLIKIKRKQPCEVVSEVEKTLGYGTGGISEVAKESMNRVLECPAEKPAEIAATDDVVSAVQDLGYHQNGYGFADNPTGDGGFWADNIGFANTWIDPNMEVYPARKPARMRLLNRLLKIADKIPGGLSDKSKKHFDPKQLEMGQKVEMEHTNNLEIAKEITRDHLIEFPEYYTALDKMEKELKDKNDVIGGSTPLGHPYSEMPSVGAIPGYIEKAEIRRKRRKKILKMLQEIESENPPEQPKGISSVGLGKTYDGGELSNTFMNPSATPGSPNAGSNVESAGLVQL